MGKCISRQAQAAATDADNAAKKCKTERESMGVEKFNETYGTNVNKKNAFGKCVSGYAKKQARSDRRQRSTQPSLKSR